MFGFTLKCKSKKKGTSTINKVKENWDEIYASLARRFSGEIELRNPLSKNIPENGVQNQTGQDLDEGTKSGNSFNSPPVSPPPSSSSQIRDREGFSEKMEKSEEKANSEPENVADNLGEKTNSVWGENDDKS